jgi:hypothetical protein
LAVWGQRLRYYASLPITPQASREADLPVSHPTSLDALFQPCASSTLLRHPITQSVQGGIGISTDCPSPTPFGLGLGPGLPWEDEPSPGILRFPAGRILTCLLAYSCRHSHFSPVHMSLRSYLCAENVTGLSLSPKLRHLVESLVCLNPSRRGNIFVANILKIF